jgi:outer membrane receptor for ferrienterochelin and colicins
VKAFVVTSAAIILLVATIPRMGRAQDPAEVDAISFESLLDIVVSATLREQSTLEAPASIQVVSAADIQARGYRTISAIMNDVPGFNEVSDTNEEIVAVRGVFASTTNKILILVNGHRMNDLMLGRYNTDQFLGMEAIERVEFIRGPASALYGTGALVGIVNIITKNGTHLNPRQLKLRGGPYGREASASWGRQLVGYDAFFAFTYRDALGQELTQPAELDVVPEGQEKAPGKIYLGRYRQNFSGLLNLRSENTKIALRGARFSRVTPRGSNGSFYDYDNEPFKPTYTESDFLVDYQYAWMFGGAGENKLTINPSVHFFSYYEQSFITFGANRVPPLGQRSGKQAELSHYELKLKFERQLLDELHFISGVDGLLAGFYRSDGIAITDGQVVVTPQGYTPTGHWFLGGVFAQAVWSPAQPLTLTLGARFDTFQKEADPELTPRLGIVYKPMRDMAVKILYGRSYLAPMWAHKRAEDPNFQGNPNLKPESFEGYDLVVAYGDKRLSGSIDLFYNKVDNLINGIRQTSGTDGAISRYENAAKSLYMGAEIAGAGQVTSWLRLEGSYSYLQPATDPDETTTSLLIEDSIKHIPSHTYRYGVRLDPHARLSLHVWGRATSSTYTDDNVTGKGLLPAVAVLDASLSFTWRQLTLQLIGTNLTNRYYERGGTGLARPLARESMSIEGAITLKL